MINTRFGYSVGNQVFHLYSKHLAQSLQQHDELYRWTGPGFIALIERAAETKQQPAVTFSPYPLNVFPE